jgi:hypothetical protein
MSKDLFTGTTPPEITSFKEHLVGEGKKFADDEALARGKYEADEFIEQLKREQDELRKELATRMTLEEFWEKTHSQSKTNEDQGTPPPREPAAQSNAPTKEEIAELVRQQLSEATTQSQKVRNVEYVKSELAKTFGPNFSEKLRQRAEELGSSIDFLGSMAETQPKAFLTLMTGGVVTTTPPRHDAPPRTQVRTEGPSPKTGKTFKDYERIRRENPTLYWQASTQQEIFKAAKELGEAFYKS